MIHADEIGPFRKFCDDNPSAIVTSTGLEYDDKTALILNAAPPEVRADIQVTTPTSQQ